MGLLGWYKERQKAHKEKTIQKYLRVIKNHKSIRDERLVALEFFRGYPDPNISVSALLQRFEYSLEHGINDTREKESAMEGILERGEAAFPIVREHLLKTTRIAWPIKALKQLASEEAVIQSLQDSLNYGDISFDEAGVDKNYDILCYLIEYKMPGFSKKLAHFLEDPDERVRFAATEVIMEQDDPEIPDLLEHFLSDESAENRRIHQAVVDLFLKNEWPVKDIEPFVDKQVAPGVTVNKKGILNRSHSIRAE